MNSIVKMQNTIQNYAWGSRSAIAQIMGRTYPTEVPEAELWLGAHPKSSSRVWVDNEWQNMDKWIAQSPIPILSRPVCEKFNGTLPYLLKIIAAAQPLSIQVHPNKEQARKGFERENVKKIQMDAISRNYKDPYHKPEYLCALTPFWALCGFRERRDIHANLAAVWPDNYRADLEIIDNSDIKSFFKNLMHMGHNDRNGLIQKVIQKASSHLDPTIDQQWMIRLHAQYPDDIGVLSPAFLNLIQLQPGEALALESGQLHSYLEGLCIELMANSDNVLRGGLTPKHVDVPELLSVLTFDSCRPKIVNAASGENNEEFYPSLVEEFKLSVIETTPKNEYIARDRIKAPEILLCIKGKASIAWQNGLKTMVIDQGQSVFVTAAADQYRIEGESVVYKATVNMAY